MRRVRYVILAAVIVLVALTWVFVYRGNGPLPGDGGPITVTKVTYVTTAPGAGGGSGGPMSAFAETTTPPAGVTVSTGPPPPTLSGPSR